MNRIRTLKSATAAQSGTAYSSACPLAMVTSTASLPSAALPVLATKTSPFSTAEATPLRRRTLSFSNESDALPLIMIIVLSGIVVLGLFFTAAVRSLHRFTKRKRAKVAAKKTEEEAARKAAAAKAALPQVSLPTAPPSTWPPDSPLSSVELPDMPPVAHRRPPNAISSFMHAALSHHRRPPSTLSTIKSVDSPSFPSPPLYGRMEDQFYFNGAQFSPHSPIYQATAGQGDGPFNPYAPFDPYAPFEALPAKILDGSSSCAK